MPYVNLEAPWDTYRKKLNALFEHDKDIEVCEFERIEDNNYILDIYAKTHKKAMALEKVLPSCKTFGNMVVEIAIHDEENDKKENLTEVYETLFKGNPIVKDFKNATDPAGYSHGFVRFKPEVIQFFDDNLTDYNGNWNGLAEDIAREVFVRTKGVNFCTAPIGKECKK